ncbi:hypothetical protein ARMGADRAFT_1012112 [Armillaria gallica]|uniref:Uncharacterized protein n=1 Tax=Armillaria gallica TaxID=47427 RepID=A0A2H3E089_ARMGA|nr:hypothetical protein ARMGADRAFT_1012112 [Armillaria gallica]
MHDLATKPDIPIVSSFGPAKHEPLLVAGQDESSEELRFQASKVLSSGNVNQYV